MYHHKINCKLSVYICQLLVYSLHIEVKNLAGDGYVDVDRCIDIAIYDRCHRSVVDTSGSAVYMVRANTNAVTLDCHSRIHRGSEQ